MDDNCSIRSNENTAAHGGRALVIRAAMALIPSSGGRDKFDELVSLADTAMGQLAAGEIRLETLRNKRLNRTLAAVYALYLEGKNDPVRYEKFLSDRRVKLHAGAATDHYLLVKALIPSERERQETRQQITTYGQALAGLELCNLAADKALEWLNTREHVGQTEMSGVRKAVAIFKRRTRAHAGGSAALPRAVDRDHISDVLAAEELEGPATEPCSLALITRSDAGKITIQRILTDDPDVIARVASEFAA